MSLGAQASACSIVVIEEPSNYEKMRRARETIAEAAAVIDGEVIAPYRSEEEPAVVRAEHVLKGPARAEFRVAARRPAMRPTPRSACAPEWCCTAVPMCIPRP
ncbi:hypothetical protein SGCZBJ_00715 [Caulobacter zeae]|uniref:Uncharacterized protein n=1 Tax=Caulobacter zeae TaxID=2055137 RepID=A0A2N5DSG7_9CAUL|nr:hypothetical protein [Caulobacter zeae]PLR28992.1 hypothetical protein SGCZBJ_00715 [Caulobacter zeae]